MSRQYKRIVIGATFYGCGVAAANPEDSLVLEPSILVGCDYTLNFNPGSGWEYEPKHPLAEKFLNELKLRNALVDGRIHQPALCPVFSQWCLDAGLEVALSTRVLAMNDNELTVFDIEGRHQLKCDEVIDARPNPGDPKRFTASLFINGLECAGKYEGFEIVAGRFESEAFLLMPVAAEMTYYDARIKLFNLWQKRPDKLQACSIAATGVRFDYNKSLNPVAALDAGLRRRYNAI